MNIEKDFKCENGEVIKIRVSLSIECISEKIYWSVSIFKKEAKKRKFIHIDNDQDYSLYSNEIREVKMMMIDRIKNDIGL